MPRAKKDFYEYIVETSGKQPLKGYSESPAVAFLKYAVDAKDASNRCTKLFPKKANGEYTKDSLDSIQVINAGLLAALMGNFETYQKYLFANMFDYSVYLNKFSVKDLIKQISKEINNSQGVVIDVERFSAYRDNKVSVGLIFSDNLKNWQSPTTVNSYFKSFNQLGARSDIFSNDTKEALSILWQMRHSIVHTASTITIPDSHKVDKLSNFGNKTIALAPNFICEVVRKMHPIIRDATNNMKVIYLQNLKAGLDASLRNKIDNVFKVSSPCGVWLR